LDADTGAVVWHTQIDGSVLGLAVVDGLVYATPSRGTRGDVAAPVVTDTYQPSGSYAIALDASTGEVRWTSDRLDDGNPGNGTFINASPVVFEAGRRRMVFVPLSGGSGDGARVPMYFLDALTGATIAKAYSLTDAEYDEGYGGTGIWTTAAYDAATGHLFAGTADSDGRTRQHPYNDAILRIDADPRRATFASVVGAYSGTTEHANLDPLVGYPHNPLCGALGEEAGLQPPTFFDTSAAPECLELDLDFGASPNLYTDAAGDLVVAALQKSGVFHAVDTTSMIAKWTFFVGPGGPAMHAATAAVGDDRIHVGATPNLVFGLDRRDGSLGWASTTTTDLFAYQPLTLANGVLYVINDLGMLVAIDAGGGAPLMHRPIAVDGGFQQCLGVGAGVAVARHTVYVPCDAGGPVDLAGVPSSPGGVVAYRLG
ncbi:MAG: PQQ-binding-like beta-propeller repeat protein, partial [Actinomycetota bacterium]|nr:PQQ-binding-like beta-propeller repeat protein [Actinomycetota bacterium]